ncbi:MAG: cyclase family protein [Candidatus Heimdallarchaeota archaeon]|nr:cyclase family protein [Candidatus Heimdallarchaeota archaeon]
MSHSLYENMPGYQFKLPDGSIEHFTLKISSILEREETLPIYQNQTSFLLGKIQMHTAVGTYIDVPYHRYKDAKDITDFELTDFILNGVIIDATGHNHEKKIWNQINNAELENKAVLFNFGKSHEWGLDSYSNCPALSEEAIDKLISLGVKLVGVDTINVDDTSRPHRPAHSKFLANNIFIIENLTNLEKLENQEFKLFAVPLNIKKAPNIPVRAFAEVK